MAAEIGRRGLFGYRASFPRISFYTAVQGLRHGSTLNTNCQERTPIKQGCRQQSQRPTVAYQKNAVSRAVSRKSRRHFLLAQEYFAEALALRRSKIRIWRLAIKRHARVSFYGVLQLTALRRCRRRSYGERCRPLTKRGWTAHQVSFWLSPAPARDHWRRRHRNRRWSDVWQPRALDGDHHITMERLSNLEGALTWSIRYPRVEPGRTS